MTSPHLERLARAGELKPEGVTARELEGLLDKARSYLADASKRELSVAGRFSLAYGAAHSLASAALRIHGYRSASRYLVFQCLEHTARLTPAQCRFFALCHERRNRAEYQGRVEIDETLLEELLLAAGNLLERVSGMVPSATGSSPAGE